VVVFRFLSDDLGIFELLDGFRHGPEIFFSDVGLWVYNDCDHDPMPLLIFFETLARLIPSG
jgi:hypothetical protein